mgnify:CR=1 FL=1
MSASVDCALRFVFLSHHGFIGLPSSTFLLCTVQLFLLPYLNSVAYRSSIQPFSRKFRTPTVAKDFQIGHYDPAEADLELFRNSWLECGIL